MAIIRLQQGNAQHLQERERKKGKISVIDEKIFSDVDKPIILLYKYPKSYYHSLF